jgi:threonyl-tRNA synthetase
MQYGYEEVITPQVFTRELWERSGHWEHYREDMFTVSRGRKDDDGDGGTVSAAEDESTMMSLKPMNCPAHCLVFASARRSYRDLPMRLADFSPLHRDEATGALGGLTRVRRFHQDDAHIFCTEAQVGAEVQDALAFVQRVYEMLGMTVSVVLSTRPEEKEGGLAAGPAASCCGGGGNGDGDGDEISNLPSSSSSLSTSSSLSSSSSSSLGDDATWARAEGALREALDASRLPWTESPGDGAFYGPKIDVTATDAAGRGHQCATIQLDFVTPRRFDLRYDATAAGTEGADADDARPRPVMIHRAALGSVERLMAIMLEATGGNLPSWLHPRQVALIPVDDRNVPVDAASTTAGAASSTSSSTSSTSTGTGTTTRTAPSAVEMCERVARGLPAHMTSRVIARPGTLGARIRRAREEGWRWIAVVGDREVENGTVNVKGFGEMRPEDLPGLIAKPGEPERTAGDSEESK